MLKVEVMIKDGYYDIPGGWIKPEVVEALLINVTWHPIEGPQGAVVMPWGEIELWELGKIAVLDQ